MDENSMEMEGAEAEVKPEEIMHAIDEEERKLFDFLNVAPEDRAAPSTITDDSKKFSAIRQDLLLEMNKILEQTSMTSTKMILMAFKALSTYEVSKCKCQNCARTFQIPRGFIFHCAKKHPYEGISQMDIQKASKVNAVIFCVEFKEVEQMKNFCFECVTYFDNHAATIAHKSRQSFTCQVCFNTFAKCAYLKVHRAESTPCANLECGCGANFETLSLLTSHKKVCEKSLSVNLKALDQFLENDAASRTCHICDLTFSMPMQLRHHMNRLHKLPADMRLKKTDCVSCLESFKFSGQMLKHLQDHRVPKYCDVCNTVFKPACSYTYHAKLCGSKYYLYTCSVCESTFFHKKLVNDHLFNEHKRKKDECGFYITTTLIEPRIVNPIQESVKEITDNDETDLIENCQPSTSKAIDEDVTVIDPPAVVIDIDSESDTPEEQPVNINQKTQPAAQKCLNYVLSSEEEAKQSGADLDVVIVDAHIVKIAEKNILKSCNLSYKKPKKSRKRVRNVAILQRPTVEEISGKTSVEVKTEIDIVDHGFPIERGINGESCLIKSSHNRNAKPSQSETQARLETLTIKRDPDSEVDITYESETEANEKITSDCEPKNDQIIHNVMPERDVKKGNATNECGSDSSVVNIKSNETETIRVKLEPGCDNMTYESSNNELLVEITTVKTENEDEESEDDESEYEESEDEEKNTVRNDSLVNVERGLSLECSESMKSFDIEYSPVKKPTSKDKCESTDTEASHKRKHLDDICSIIARNNNKILTPSQAPTVTKNTNDAAMQIDFKLSDSKSKVIRFEVVTPNILKKTVQESKARVKRASLKKDRPPNILKKKVKQTTPIVNNSPTISSEIILLGPPIVDNKDIKIEPLDDIEMNNTVLSGSLVQHISRENNACIETISKTPEVKSKLKMTYESLVKNIADNTNLSSVSETEKLKTSIKIEYDESISRAMKPVIAYDIQNSAMEIQRELAMNSYFNKTGAVKQYGAKKISEGLALKRKELNAALNDAVKTIETMMDLQEKTVEPMPKVQRIETIEVNNDNKCVVDETEAEKYFRSLELQKVVRKPVVTETNEESSEFEDDLIVLTGVEAIKVESNDVEEMLEPSLIPKTSGRTICETCGRKFSTNNYIEHINKGECRRSTLEKFKCDLCKFEADDAIHYMSHWQKHGIDKNTCIKCFRYFANEKLLFSHVRGHIRAAFAFHIIYIVCKKCNREIKHSMVQSFTHWEKHVFNSHRFKMKSSMNKEVKPSQKKTKQKRTKYDTCNVDLPTNPDMSVVGQVLCSMKNNKTAVLDRRCPACNKQFNRNNMLRVHLIVHLIQEAKTNTMRGTALSCTLCSKSVGNLSELKEHLRQHAGATSFRCNYCAKQFSCSSNLAKHKKIHGFSVLQCDICKRKFHIKRRLIEHMTRHTNTQVFECEMCDRKFYFESDYKRHEKTYHTEGHRTKCQLCEERFSSTKDRLNHEWSVHNYSKVQYVCPVCPARERHLMKLRKHVMDAHNISAAALRCKAV